MAETYKCLNPVGMQPPVKQSALAPRLDTLDGKTIHLSICGEMDIWVPLEKKLKADYPNINFTVKKGNYVVGGINLGTSCPGSVISSNPCCLLATQPATIVNLKICK